MTLERLLILVVTAISIYAWKDWFASLCCLILMMAVLESSRMPKNMYGIQGFNPWNFLFIAISLAWLINRRFEGLRWDMPRHINVLLLMYLAVVVIGALRAILDFSYSQNHLLRHIISDRLINTVKWVLPGILLFDGCRTRRRLVMVLVCLVGVYFLIAMQVNIRMPIRSAFTALDDERHDICNSIGYQTCDMSTMLGGAFWATLAMMPLVRQSKYRVLILAVACLVLLGQMLTGGRVGYVAWGATGLMLCLLKWRKYLILAPVIVILLPLIFSGPVKRMQEGFGVTDVAGQSMTDGYTVTSGRTVAWPLVIDKIGKSLLIGYGRRAMERTGLSELLLNQYGEKLFAHPHNMYLETLLDNGILGSIPILLFWAVTVLYSGKLFRSDNPYCSAVGGLALALILSQLFGGIGAQHFYPTESTLGMWAAMFLSLRIYIEEKRMQMGAINAVDSWNSQTLGQQRIIASVYALK